MQFTEDFLFKIFANDEMRKIPCGAQSTAIHAMETLLADILKENEYATISELFSTESKLSISESV